MRPIDADELRPDVRLKDGTLCFSKSRIANAPTIEPTTVYEFKGCDNCELDRPKGKWKVIGLVDDYAYCKCSECGNTTRLYRDSKNEFCCIADIRNKVIACMYCGADMREVKNNG